MLHKLLGDSPSLASFLADILAEEYAAAVSAASDETGMALGVFPETCPFLVDDVLNQDFLPEDE